MGSLSLARGWHKSEPSEPKSDDLVVCPLPFLLVSRLSSAGIHRRRERQSYPLHKVVHALSIQLTTTALEQLQRQLCNTQST